MHAMKSVKVTFTLFLACLSACSSLNPFAATALRCTVDGQTSSVELVNLKVEDVNVPDFAALCGFTYEE